MYWKQGIQNHQNIFRIKEAELQKPKPCIAQMKKKPKGSPTAINLALFPSMLAFFVQDCPN